MLIGPHTRRFVRAMRRLIAVTRQGLGALERYPDMRRRLAARRRQGDAATDTASLAATIAAMQELGKEVEGVRLSYEEHLEAAALEWAEMQHKAMVAWDTGSERMPRRWLLRNVAELQQLQAKLADIQERIAIDLANALARREESD